MTELMSLEEILSPSRCALLVWDMQNGIAARAMRIGEVRLRIDELIEAARERGVPVVWSRHVAPLPAQMTRQALRSLLRRQGVSSVDEAKDYMRDGSAEVEFLDGMAPADDEVVITKTTPSLFVGTTAELRLRAKDVETLVLVGVATEQGVEFTARHAAALGYFPVVVEDAVSSFTDEAHQLGLSFLRQAVDVVPTEAVVKAWRSQPGR